MRKLLLILFMSMFMLSLASAFDFSTQGKAYYNFNEAAGTSANDSFHNYNISVSNNWSNGGIISNAYVPNGATLSTTTLNQQNINLTMNFWVYRTGSWSAATFFMVDGVSHASGNPTNNGDWRIRTTGADGLLVDVRDGVGAKASSSSTFSLNTWTMFTVKINSTSLTTYKDGSLVSTTILSGFVFSNKNLDLFGRSGLPAQYITNTRVDEFYIVNRTLSNLEVSELYNSGAGLSFSVTPTQELLVELDYPTDDLGITDVGELFNASYTSIGYNFTNASYYIWNSNGSLFNKTTVTVLGNSTNSSSLYIDDFTLGLYDWNVELCARNTTTHVCKFADNNLSFSVGASTTNVTYNTGIYETSSQTFSSVISILPTSTLYDIQFIYDGETYDATYSTSNDIDYNVNVTIDIPLVTLGINQNKSFYYRYVYDIGDTFLYQNSESYNQSVKIINITSCSTGNITANFTAYNEENMTRLSPYNFLATFDYWLGSGGKYKTYSINSLNAIEQVICLSDYNQTYKTNAVIQYEKTGYIKRNYYLVNTSLTNASQSIDLFLLDSTVGTSYIINVKDNAQAPVSNAYLYIQRYYPGTNQYETVGMVKTDLDGSSVFSFEDETEDYRIIVFKDGEILYTSAVQKIYCTAAPCTLTFTIEEALGYPWSPFLFNSSIVTSLYYNSTTNLTYYTYVDVSGSVQSGRLVVKKVSPGNRTITTICDTSETESSAIITCAVTEQGTYLAIGYIDGVEANIIQFTIKVVPQSLKTEGLFIALFIVMVAGFAFIWNPSAGIIAINAALIFTNMIGLLSLSPVFIFGSIAVSILALILLKT